nr:uncharacterized protein LOC126538418 isoform X1 [Dermacentor andersoni]
MSTAVRVLRQAVGQAAKALHLEPFKRVTVRIDPFHSNATPVRDFLFHVSTSRVRLTNPECAVKTEVLCDRSEPTIEIALCNGRSSSRGSVRPPELPGSAASGGPSGGPWPRRTVTS